MSMLCESICHLPSIYHFAAARDRPTPCLLSTIQALLRGDDVAHPPAHISVKLLQHVVDKHLAQLGIRSCPHYNFCMAATPTYKIMGRSSRLPSSQRKIFDRIFQSGDGYVLDFSDRTMAEWFQETCGLNIFQERFQVEGSSKAKTLRGFVAVAEPRLVAQVLRTLWVYRCNMQSIANNDPDEEARLSAWLEQFASELEASSAVPLEEAIRDFSGDSTLTKLRASIATDLIAERPDVALDRVHTYCVKRFRHLLSARGQKFDPNTPLHALFGAYGRILKETAAVSDFALPTLRVQHKLFEGLNDIRNKRSLAHDNELLDISEARFVIDCVLSSMAFIERIEEGRN
jgi:Abortive infection C-terminus